MFLGWAENIYNEFLDEEIIEVLNCNLVDRDSDYPLLTFRNAISQEMHGMSLHACEEDSPDLGLHVCASTVSRAIRLLEQEDGYQQFTWERRKWRGGSSQRNRGRQTRRGGTSWSG